LFCAERDFRWRRAPGGWQWEGPDSRRFGLPEPALRGDYQLANGAAVLMVAELLEDRLPVPQEAVRLGLQTAMLPGRFQVIPGDVTLVLDVAHNPQAAAALAGNLRRLAPGGRVHAVFGLLGDKDLRGVLQPLAELVDSWHLPQLAGIRARPVADLARELCAILPGVEVTEYPAPRLALSGAHLAAAVGDCILVFGSFVLVGELLPQL
jgi:dihydrofolate synthase/folylpolyglutamate synthase